MLNNNINLNIKMLKQNLKWVLFDFHSSSHNRKSFITERPPTQSSRQARLVLIII